jgi:hypothetical protein
VTETRAQTSRKQGSERSGQASPPELTSETIEDLDAALEADEIAGGGGSFGPGFGTSGTSR